MGDITLIASDVLAYEIERNPNPTRREYALEVLSKAAQWIVLNEAIEAAPVSSIPGESSP